ncbi:MAG: tRNA pseudouridine(38-40) synthase TruA [Ignavibacteriae bacterium]|nr:tRNA pseudouridine(38-40) synthase TruA [Ignavibacteriota bacterium]
MSRLKIKIEYEGTRYSGWQIQKNARTIQGELMSAVKTVFQTTDFEFYGSGRTDAGVHALEQVAHLDVHTVLAPHIIRMKLNDELPADINILDVEKTSKTFHARHDAEARSYLYQISKRRTAFGKRFVWWIKDRLNVQQMQTSSQLFIGLKNLQSFTADDPEEKSTKALIDEIRILEDDNLILLRITSSHFLWKMVRQIVGVLAEVGRGSLSIQDVERFLKIKSGEPAKFTAPPSGLFLEKIYYKGDERLTEMLPTLRM